ncbi:protein NLRC3-like [Boleophthalmus pectinirostris]|uniref:protein NLRC3-like n=1 Tax=Boleophthalmus pectinirostris TaxID=150288 RepID=UPI0024300115|nr:protein NLRC3-like [Boleophthalmus pectinirostris]
MSSSDEDKEGLSNPERPRSPVTSEDSFKTDDGDLDWPHCLGMEADSSERSCLSLKSDFSKDVPLNFKQQDLDEGMEADSSERSCLSLKSDFSKDVPLNFKQQDLDEGEQMPSVSRAPDPFSEMDSVFEALHMSLLNFMRSELKRLREVASANCMDCFKKAEEAELDEWERPKEAFLDITLHLLRNMKQGALADSLKNKLLAPVCQCQLKSRFKANFQMVFEGIQETGKASHLDEIYTELYLTEGDSKMNEEHEVTQIQLKQTKRTIRTLKCSDLFIAAPVGQRNRAVLTKGVAGVGKTLLTQRFSLDWAEAKSHQDLHFIFPFTFRELNLLKEESLSLYGLIGHFFTETNHGVCRFEEFQCLFILDGLDESRLQLDFSKTPSVSDVREKTSIETLLVNLIRGTLLPSAQIWITTRPAAANQIPAECVGMVTEVGGFTDAQKEMYFRKKFRDEDEASKVVSHVKASRSVYSLCYIPVFSWITAKVMDYVLRTGGGQLPQTLTELYIHFLVVQAKISNVKYKDQSERDFIWSSERKKNLMVLSRLAFEQLQKGNLIFYESDLSECGIDVTEASVHSGVFTQMFKEETGLYQDKVFSFVHLSIQEFLAALHVHITFMDSEVNLLSDKPSFWSKMFYSKTSMIQFYRTAVDTALESPNGLLDLFLRFLLGLSLECNQSLLRGLMKPTGSSQIKQETAQYLRAKLDSGLSVERNLTLLQCLIELKDTSLCEKVQACLSSEKIPSDLSPAQWSTLVCILVSTEEPEFDLSKYQPSETALLHLMPVVSLSSKVLLSGCGVSDRGCEALASVLGSQCCLRDLDLSQNPLQDSGLLLLCEGLKRSDCALQTLRLSFCDLFPRSCEALASVLDSEKNSLMELDLSNNDLQDSGVKTLSSALKSPRCKLETLRSGQLTANIDLTSIIESQTSLFIWDSPSFDPCVPCPSRFIQNLEPETNFILEMFQV